MSRKNPGKEKNQPGVRFLSERNLTDTAGAVSLQYPLRNPNFARRDTRPRVSVPSLKTILPDTASEYAEIPGAAAAPGMCRISHYESTRTRVCFADYCPERLCVLSRRRVAVNKAVKRLTLLQSQNR